MMVEKLIRFLFIFFLISIQTVQSQDQPAFITDSLDTYVNRALEMYKMPGVAVLVIKDGKSVVKKGYGLRELGEEAPVDTQTLFMIGSNTKAFTGTAVAMLAEEGKCSLNDPVQKYLPGFTMKDKWVAEHLNLTDILCHRMGMETFQGDFMYWDSDLTQEETIEKFGQLTPMYDFRTRWGYTNAGFVLAGAVIEKITGQTWGQYLRKAIFEPLEMNRTLPYAADIANASNKAAAHTLVGGELVRIPYGHFDNLAAVGAISSSIEDMSHWVMAQLDGGRYNGEQVLPVRAIRATRQPYSINRGGHPFNRNQFNLYGLGWNLSDYEGWKVVSHTGGVNGFVTSVTLLPEQNLGVVVLTNTDENYFYEALKWEIVDAYLGLPYRNYSGVYHSAFERSQSREQKEIQSWRDSAAMKLKPELPLKAYAGHYEHEVYGGIDIEKNGKSLSMTFEHHPQLTANLQPLGGNRFLCTYSDPLFGIKVFPFKTDGRKAQSFVLSVADFLEFTTYEFVRE